MKRKWLYLILSISLLQIANGQKISNGFGLGINAVGGKYDFSDSRVVGAEPGKLSNLSLGFSATYQLTYRVSDRWVVGSGLTLEKLKAKFSRPYYNFSNNIDPNPYAVAEKLSISRIGLPLFVDFSLSERKDGFFYITGGSTIYLFNQYSRQVAYFLQQPPTGYVEAKYKQSRVTQFDSPSLQINVFAGIGREFNIQELPFFAEVMYSTDTRSNVFQSLTNIEEDGEIKLKLTSMSLKIGCRF